MGTLHFAQDGTYVFIVEMAIITLAIINPWGSSIVYMIGIKTGI